MTVSIDTTCCGREMQALGVVDVLSLCGSTVKRWLCPECGYCIDLVDSHLDEELCLAYLNLYGKSGPEASGSEASASCGGAA